MKTEQLADELGVSMDEMRERIKEKFGFDRNGSETIGPKVRNHFLDKLSKQSAQWGEKGTWALYGEQIGESTRPVIRELCRFYGFTHMIFAKEHESTRENVQTQFKDVRDEAFAVAKTLSKTGLETGREKFQEIFDSDYWLDQLKGVLVNVKQKISRITFS